MSNPYIEQEFICKNLQLEKQIQELYNVSREMAQKGNWTEHLKLASKIIPLLQYLTNSSDKSSDDWISRILGRMAWSYIRLDENYKAGELLKFSESYDYYQAAANYYWASEYAHRTNQNRFALQYLEQFKRVLIENRIEVRESNKSYLDLAVDFYKKLTNIEHESASFEEKNNQSDIGRYFELLARKEQNADFYLKAGRSYRLSGLLTYEACCNAFAHITKAIQSEDLNKALLEFEIAYETILNTEIFADEHIKELLLKFLYIRVKALKLMTKRESETTTLDQLENGIDEIKSLILDDNSSNKSFASLASLIPKLNQSESYIELEHYISQLAEIKNISHSAIKVLNELLDKIVYDLPSYSFLYHINK